MSRNDCLIIGKNSPMSQAGRKREENQLKPNREFKKYLEVFLSRVAIEALDAEIIEHFKKMNLRFYGFKRLKTQATNYLSFYFKVDYDQKDIVLDKGNWPDGVLVREFVRSYAKF